MRTAAICSAARRWRRRTRRGCRRSSKRRFANTECRWAIRTDNGAPFASRAIAGLSRLAVWWMKLGIVPERIEAGHPEQNGRHERMHRTLKEETASPAAANRGRSSAPLIASVREYNEQRPHEALGMQTPSAVYVPSPREFPARVREPEYDSALLVRRVDCTGHSRGNM